MQSLKTTTDLDLKLEYSLIVESLTVKPMLYQCLYILPLYIFILHYILVVLTHQATVTDFLG